MKHLKPKDLILHGDFRKENPMLLTEFEMTVLTLINNGTVIYLILLDISSYILQ